VSENISVLRPSDGSLCWQHAGEPLARDLRDARVADDFRQALSQRSHRVVFAAPGPQIRLLELDVTREEKRHLDAALPFMLEDALAEDIEQLHFARCALSEERVGVAALRHSAMEDWDERLADWPGIGVWVPESLLLPWEAGQWTVLIDGQQALLRYGHCLGASIEQALLPPLLNALAQTHEPGHIVIYGQDEARDRACLPASLLERAQWRRGGLGEALLLLAPDAELLNLRQGLYAPRLPYERWWRQSRRIAALLLVAFMAHLIASWLDLRQLEAENLALRSEIQSVYREVNPRGAVADAEKQLKRQLAALGGGADGGGGFTALLEPLAKLVSQQDGAALASLNYSQSSDELRVNMLAADFAAVETIRSGLVEAGFSATLESSSRSGQRVRARLRIGGSS